MAEDEVMRPTILPATPRREPALRSCDRSPHLSQTHPTSRTTHPTSDQTHPTLAHIAKFPEVNRRAGVQVLLGGFLAADRRVDGFKYRAGPGRKINR